MAAPEKRRDVAQGTLFHVRVRGPMACFTRPEFKAERVSYELMTPSAARGVLEAIFWKPAIRWHIHRIAVLAPIRWTSFRRNEVRDLASPRIPFLVASDPEQRSQRNTLALRDVDYLVTCGFELTSRAGESDNMPKFSKMFQQRLERGQHFEPPYLGMREFAADVEPATRETLEPIERGVTRRLGQMFFDFEPVEIGRGRQLFFEAQLDSGVLHVPPLQAVLRDNGVRARRAR
jgi:CRISPR-associated protein Cas5d